MPTMEIRITNYVSIDPDYVWWNRYANAPILYNVDTGRPRAGSYDALEDRGPIFMGDDYFVRIEQQWHGDSLTVYWVVFNVDWSTYAGEYREGSITARYAIQQIEVSRSDSDVIYTVDVPSEVEGLILTAKRLSYKAGHFRWPPESVVIEPHYYLEEYNTGVYQYIDSGPTRPYQDFTLTIDLEKERNVQLSVIWPGRTLFFGSNMPYSPSPFSDSISEYRLFDLTHSSDLFWTNRVLCEETAT